MSNTTAIEKNSINDDNASNVDIGVAKQQRVLVAEHLSKFLATTYTLYMKSLYYHWNVTGQNFHSLHNLFEEHYEDLHEAGDKIAERIRALGHFAPGTFKEYQKFSKVQEDETVPNSADDMVRNLLADHETCSIEARSVLEQAKKAGDEVTIDMMVERMSVHDEAAWMLRSIIQ